MATEIAMPQLSDTMDQGRILTWHKKEGDLVKRGESLAEVATDKADLEIESFHEGTLLKIYAPAGTTVKVGSVIAVIGNPGEKVAEQEPTASDSVKPCAEDNALSGPQPASEALVVADPQARVKISPLARKIAETQGIDYRSMVGTGEGGRIVRRDIEDKLAKAASISIATSDLAKTVASQTPAPGSSKTLSPMRQTIAKRMVESKTTIPHFYVTAKAHVDELEKVKNKLKKLPQYAGITYNHMVIRAAVLAMRSYPTLNGSYRDGSYVQPESVNIGIITAVADGLLIPVLKNADKLSLAEIVAEAKALVDRARSGEPKSTDLLGATFSISNMGRVNVEHFSGIIGPGLGAMLAIGSVLEEPIVVEGNVRPGKVMRLTLSLDHRIIDGLVAGEFITELVRLLEEPVLLLA